MDSAEYWAERALRDALKQKAFTAREYRKIAAYFEDVLKKMGKTLDDFYRKYADEKGISLAAAITILNDPQWLQTSIEEYRTLSESYLDDPVSTELLDKIGGARYVTRQQGLLVQLNLLVSQAYLPYHERVTAAAATLFEQSYYKCIFDEQQFRGYGAAFNRISTNQIMAAVDTDWSGKSYSERIWEQREQLSDTLEQVVTKGMAAGMTRQEMQREFRKAVDSSLYSARRLINTECAYVVGESTMRGYRENGTEKYRFLATLDISTSAVCRELDNKVFSMEEAKVGVNYNPMHPHCRSRTVPDHPEEQDKENTREARGTDGKTYKVPADMSYSEWYEKHIKSDPAALLQERKMKNIAKDNAQFTKYKGVLGKDAPKSLEDFQNMKYTDAVGWEDLKDFVKYKRKYPSSDRRYFNIGKDLKAAGISCGLPLPPVPKRADIIADPISKRDPNHILKRMVERGITSEELAGYVSDAKVMFTQWNGQRQAFYSRTGVSVLMKYDQGWFYKTGWKREDFDDETEKVLEVIDKYVK